jgi:hypothetical protein
MNENEVEVIKVELSDEQANTSLSLINLDKMINNTNDLILTLINRGANNAFTEQFDVLNRKVADYSTQKELIFADFSQSVVPGIVPTVITENNLQYDVRYNYYENIAEFIVSAEALAQVQGKATAVEEAVDVEIPAEEETEEAVDVEE